MYYEHQTIESFFVGCENWQLYCGKRKELDLPASSISRYIASLENELGQRLFHRHTRAVKLTEVGAYYFAEVREALTSLDLATEHAKGSLLTPQGNLNINAPVSFGRLHLSKLIFQFQQRYPDINVELMLTDAYVDPVANGSDVVIRIGGFEDSSLNYQAIADEQFVLCAAPSYQQSIKDKIGHLSQPKQLLDLNCLVYKGNNGRRNWFFRQEKSRHLNALKSLVISVAIMRIFWCKPL